MSKIPRLLLILQLLSVLLAPTQQALTNKETGVQVRIPQELSEALKTEVISWFPYHDISYPVIFPETIQYTFYKLWFITFKISG
jgi:hypothetical protein